jgi:hypothetical protein
MAVLIICIIGVAFIGAGLFLRYRNNNKENTEFEEILDAVDTEETPEFIENEVEYAPVDFEPLLASNQDLMLQMKELNQKVDALESLILLRSFAQVEKEKEKETNPFDDIYENFSPVDVDEPLKEVEWTVDYIVENVGRNMSPENAEVMIKIMEMEKNHLTLEEMATSLQMNKGEIILLKNILRNYKKLNRIR